MRRPANKALAMLALAAFLLSPLPRIVLADQSGDFVYAVVDNEIEITGYKGKGGAVTLPAQIAGKPVAAVADNAFKDCAALTALTVPRGVREIGYSAFAGCTGMKSVSLPYGLVSIGDYAFMNCTGLSFVTLPDSFAVIGYGAFAGCTALEAITVGTMNPNFSSVSGVLYDKNKETLICCPAGRKGYLAVPDGVVVIGQEAFAGCSGLTGISLPDSLASIGYWAFSGCTGLTGIALPASLETIGTSAFDGCAGLASVTLPAGLIDAGDNAFDGCTALASIAVESNNLTYSSRDGVLYDRTGVELIRCPEGKKGAFAIPDGVGIVADWAFSGCAWLTSISMPESVFSVGEGAFVCGPAWAMAGGNADRSAVSAFTAFSVDPFNRYFSSSNGLLYNDTLSELISVPAGRAGSLTLPGGVDAIGSYALACCTKLTEVTLPGTVSAIGANAFAYCAGLKEITIPASVSSIGAEAFYGCEGLTKAYMENALTAMGAGAFQSVADKFKIYYHVSLSQQWADFSAYAKQAYCLATVDLKDGSAASKTAADVTEGRLTPPQAPARAGFAFAGWYKDAALKTAWDFAKEAITGDVSLFAKWVVATPASPRAASASYRSVALAWGSVPDVAGYEVWRAASVSGRYALVRTTAATAYTNTNLATGRTYYYKIRAYRMDGKTKEYGAYSAVVSARPGLGAPRLSAGAAPSGGVKLTWPAVAGATKYEVWRCAASATGTYTLVATVSPAAYADTGVSAGRTYWYKVRAYRLVAGEKVYGTYSGAASAKP
jgi:uncharacterized repeat protein (TIGR02543 family)